MNLFYNEAKLRSYSSDGESSVGLLMSLKMLLSFESHLIAGTDSRMQFCGL
jgi:hypothetical protein